MIQLGEIDPTFTIWRYLTFVKFDSLIQRSALWFSKLQIFEDAQEGMTPELTRSRLKGQHREMEDWFPDEERKRQVRRFVEDNEENGRELIVASCWFISEQESKKCGLNMPKTMRALLLRAQQETSFDRLCSHTTNGGLEK